MSPDVVLQAAGTLRRSYEDVDWAATPLGPIPSWSPALRSTVDLILQTHFPVSLFWGPELVLVYNAAYVRLIADKHPRALGRPTREVFPEAWDLLGPMIESVRGGAGATWVEDASVPLVRHGVLREAYFTFSYSPVRGRDGAIEGVMNIAAETTSQVIDRRRLRMLGRLRELLAELERVEDVPERALSLLRQNAADLPAVDIVLAGSAGGRDQVPVEGEVVLPLGSAQQAVLAVRLSERLAPDERYLGFLRLVASTLSQAIDRIVALQAERTLSESLQRSLLARPIEPDHVQVAVRYLPAAELAQVGGDWYDAFMGPDGALTLVVGDVTGHDQRAAAAMAQVRNLLRGICYTVQEPPGLVVTALDEAMHGLAIGVFATAILAKVEQTGEEAERGLRTLRWCNAGHPPPVLLEPDGTARLLESEPEVLLGLGPSRRTDHAVQLRPGATVVLYTDGLVERRGAPLQERLEWLTGVVSGCQELDAEELCDHVLAQLGRGADDDIALLVLRVYPEDRPRPPEAGPSVLPEDIR